MPIEFEDMNKEQNTLSVAVYGPSGSGKTTAAFKLAMGIRDKLYPGVKLNKVGLFVDTEKRASTKAVGRTVGGEEIEPMSLYSFDPPFNIHTLTSVLEEAKKQGFKIVVVDSYTAFWSGKEGLLERVSELDVELAGAKKMYGAWSEKEIIQKKNYMKWLIRGTGMHLIICFRAKTEYVMEVNKYGKNAPKAIGLKEDMQADMRYEFDTVISIDKDTHEIKIEKDNIGFAEIRDASTDPNRPISSKDGEDLAFIATQGLTFKEIEERKKQKLIAFILDEKAHKSGKVIAFEKSQKMELTEEKLNSLSKDILTKIVNVIRY